MDNENVGFNLRKKPRDLNPKVQVIVPVSVISKTKRMGGGGTAVTASIKRHHKHPEI